MGLSKDNEDLAKKTVVVVAQRQTYLKKIRIPERIENVSLKWLREAPFFSEFLLRFHYFLTDEVPTMGVNSTRGRINLFINDQFMNGGMQWIKMDKEGKPIFKSGSDGNPLLDKDGNVEYEMEEWTGLTDKQLEGVLIHEIMHLVRVHHERIHDSQPYLWNIACDMLINNDLNDMKIGHNPVELPPGAVYLNMATKDGYKGEPVTEPLYGWLVEKQQQYINMMKDLIKNGAGQCDCQQCGGSGKVQQKSDCPSCGGSGEKQDENGNTTKCDGCGGSGEQTQEKTCPSCHGSGKQKGDSLFDAKYSSKIDSHIKMSESDELAESSIKEVIDTAKVRGWGNVSGDAVEKLEKLLSPAKISWKQLLRKALSSHVFSHGNIYENSWSRVNRRQLPLPGIKKLSTKVVIGVDTSGSIGKKEFEQFFAEVEKIIKDVSSLTVLQWDTEVKDVRLKYKKGDWRKITIKGRGGTDVQSTFDWIVENKKQHDLLVMFTDGQFDYGYDTHQVNTIWCVVNNESGDPPGGRVIHINSEEN